MSRAVLSLGSNLGDRLAHLRLAVAILGQRCRGSVAVSGVYETRAWPDDDQPLYLNAVVAAAAPMMAIGWLNLARDIERAGGRRRDPHRQHAPRTLDVDVIAVWDEDGGAVVRADDELTLPHPRAHLRAFVLRPWLDVSPTAELPGYGSVQDLLATDRVTADLGTVVARSDLELG